MNSARRPDVLAEQRAVRRAVARRDPVRAGRLPGRTPASAASAAASRPVELGRAAPGARASRSARTRTHRVLDRRQVQPGAGRTRSAAAARGRRRADRRSVVASVPATVGARRAGRRTRSAGCRRSARSCCGVSGRGARRRGGRAAARPAAAARTRSSSGAPAGSASYSAISVVGVGQRARHPVGRHRDAPASTSANTPRRHRGQLAPAAADQAERRRRGEQVGVAASSERVDAVDEQRRRGAPRSASGCQVADEVRRRRRAASRSVVADRAAAGRAAGRPASSAAGRRRRRRRAATRSLGLSGRDRGEQRAQAGDQRRQLEERRSARRSGRCSGWSARRPARGRSCPATTADDPVVQVGHRRLGPSGRRAHSRSIGCRPSSAWVTTRLARGRPYRVGPGDHAADVARRRQQVGEPVVDAPARPARAGVMASRDRRGRGSGPARSAARPGG